MAKNKYVTSGSNIQELISAVQASNKILEDTRLDTMLDTHALTNINNVIVDINESIQAIQKVIVGNHMKDLETAREQNAYNDELLEAIKNLGKGKKPDEAPKEKGEFSWLGLAGSLIAGLVMGGVAFVTEYVKGFIKFWKATAKALKIDGLIGKLFTSIEEGFMFIKNLVSGGFSKAWGFIKGFFSGGLFDDISKFFTKIVEGIKNLFKYEDLMGDFAQLWTHIKDIFKMIFDPIGKMFGGGGKGFIDDIVKYISKAAIFFEPIMGFFKVLGKILGKLAYPLQVIMSIWDTVSGALDGWNNTEGSFTDKLFGAIKGGLTGLLNGLIGGLLDLLKDGLVWILDALGFDKAVKFLESFSFSDLIGKLVGGYVDMIKGMVDWVMELFTNPKAAMAQLSDGIGKLGDMAKNFLKGLLKSVLPNPQGGVMEKLAAKAIPDSVYEFAGMDPKTGALKEATADNAAAQGEKMVNEAAAAGEKAVQGVVNSGQTIINNGNTAVVSSKSKAHDMEDMWARGGMSMMGA